MSDVSLPRLSARTLRFSLGAPRDVAVVADGRRVVFVRTPSGTSRTGGLWVLDLPADGAEAPAERQVVDPADLLGEAGEQLSAAERARRERSREAAAGIVGYSTDAASTLAAFALSGQVWVAGLDGTGARALPSTGSAIDPRIDPTGRRVAYASGDDLRVVEVDPDAATPDRVVARSEGPDVVWGRAEFVAAEEMERYRGFWWAPDGESLLVERYDDAPVPVWHVADPADPTAEPVRHRYPAAGSADALVSLWHVRLDGPTTPVGWDAVALPYLTRVSWNGHGDPLLQVMSRDQRRAVTMAYDPAAGTTRPVGETTDAVWVDLFGGVPSYGPGGRLLTVEADPVTDTNRLVVDGTPLSPAGLQVVGLVGTDDDGVLLSARPDPTELHLVHVAWDGTATGLSTGTGVHVGSRSGGTTVLTSTTPDTVAPTTTVSRGGEVVATLQHLGVDPGIRPVVTQLRAGARELRTAVLFPTGHEPGSHRLPVLMDPYGGPHALRDQASGRAFLMPQWLADQGFCVVVADGRGTPGRGPAWDRSIRDDFVGATLEDQVDALAAVAEAYPDDVDTTRVGIAGWSYGGYLAALAVLARPDVFHAAVAGAPVTDWRLYDTFYTERYLGHPDEQPEVYDRNSLAPLAAGLERPLMIIHGMVDDNVVVAHSLRLSSALLEAGRPHEVLPLTGVTHMAAQEEVAENLQLLQVEFLRRHLG